MNQTAQKSNAFLENQPIASLMRRYAVPCIISLLVAALYNIVDQIFIANASYLGSYGNAANTVVFPLTVVALALAVMVGDGCCAFVSISLGADRKEDAHKSIGSAVVLCVLAERLGIPCYDSELIQKIAQESGFAEDYVKTDSEDAKTTVLGFALTPRTYGKTNEDYLWEIQTKVIRELAEKGPCVIVGRCADSILQDKADCLTVFIHADPAFRAKRIVEVYGESTETPARRIKEKDKRRAAYHRFYTDKKWGHAQNYQIALDSGVLGLDRCVAVLAGLY